jgi:ParB family chromosome partitioning protein
MGHARTLLALSSRAAYLSPRKIDGNLTVRDAEKLVKSILQPATKVRHIDQTQSRDVEL